LPSQHCLGLDYKVMYESTKRICFFGKSSALNPEEESIPLTFLNVRLLLLRGSFYEKLCIFFDLYFCKCRLYQGNMVKELVDRPKPIFKTYKEIDLLSFTLHFSQEEIVKNRQKTCCPIPHCWSHSCCIL
jgi:hypothetical protein